MSQKSQPSQQGNQSHVLREDNAAHDEEASGPLPRPNRLSVQEPQSILHSRPVSILEPPPVSHARQVSIQEPLPVSHARRVSVQEPLPVVYARRISIQEHPPTVRTRQVSIQETPALTLARRASGQDPPPALYRVSIQEPPPTLRPRRPSAQEPAARDSTLRDSIREAPPVGSIIQKSIQGAPSVSSSQQASTPPKPPKPPPLVTYDSRVGTQLAPSLQIRRPGVPRPLAMPHSLLACFDSVAYSSQKSQDILAVPPHQGLKGPNRASVDVPPSITYSPEPSMESMESILWSSQEDLKTSLYNLQFSKNAPESDSSMLPGNPAEACTARFLEAGKRKFSQLPIGTKMLHEAKKISRQLSLALSVLGITIIGLITLGQPWVHFQVPLEPPGGPADPPPRTMPINTIFFVRCSDVSCLHEQDHNAYLLDSAWAFLFISSFTSFCLFLILLNITFYSGSSVPLLDFSNIILSNLTGTSMVLGVLFYLLQAHEFLQEGMTYSLGHSFYLAWIGIFSFMTIGLISYMNYMNFWSILAPQGIWT